MNAEQSPSAQQRIAQCVKRLDARVKRLESARVHSPAPASRSAHSESLEDEERKQLVKFYISDRMQLLKPINSGSD